MSVASNGHTIHCSSHCTSSTFSRKGAKYKSISWAEMYEFPPQFPFIIRARVCRGCLSSVLFWGRRILFVPGEEYVGYFEQGSGWTWLGFIFRNLRDLIIRQWYISSNCLKRISRSCLSVPLADCILWNYAVIWGGMLFFGVWVFLYYNGKIVLSIYFPPDRRRGVKHYSTAGAHQPFIQSRLLLMYSGLARSHAGHHQTIEQKWLRGCELKGCARLCSKRLARMERAISFQTRGIPKSMFSQKRAFHPADLLATSININIH